MFSKFLQSTLVAGVAVIGLSGCVSMGPRHINPDRIDYIQEIGESWKKQMLLNIVKLRYFDPPTFLDVSSIINQYGIENQVSVDGRWYWPVPTAPYEAGVGGYLRYSDKPTVTYTPLSGQKFTKNLLTPIPPAALISLIQSGWPIDMIFPLAVKTINGVNNSFTSDGAGNEASDFSRLTQAMRTIQLAGVSDIRVEKVDDKEAVVFVIADAPQKEQYRQQSQTVRSILKIKPDMSTYKIVFGSLAKNDEEVAILTRSMLEIMLDMASRVEVPEQHVAEKRVKETLPFAKTEFLMTNIHSSRAKPQDAFTAIQYQGYWFWIDNRDIESKRNFALLMIFMSLTETEQKNNGPLVTIGG